MSIGEYKYDRRNDVCKQFRISQQRLNNQSVLHSSFLHFSVCDKNKKKIYLKMQATYVLSLFMMMVAMCGVQSAISQVGKNLQSNGLTNNESSTGVRDVDDLATNEHHWYRRRIYRRLGKFLK